jgi:hypothetical protein
VVWPAPDYSEVAASVRGVKPNWVKHEFGPTVGRNVLLTRASLVRTLVDATLTALAGKGRTAACHETA